MKITMDKRRVKNILHKITAYLLIACMIFGTNTMSVSATTDTTNSGINALTTGEPETGTNEGDIETNEDVSPEGGSENGAVEDGGQESNTDEDTPNVEETPDKEGSNGNEESTDNEETENETESDEESDSEDIEDTEEETDEEDLLEEEVDEEEIIEEELDEENPEENDAIAAAESAFADILAQKDMMALIYLTDVYHVRSQADEASETVAELESGQTVYLRGVTITESQIWYRVQFWVNGTEQEGYVLRDYLAYADEDWRAWENEYLNSLMEENKINSAAIGGISAYSTSYEDVEAFPAGYQSALLKLKETHPNWIFVPLNTKLDFNTVVSKQMGERSLIQKTSSNSSKGWVGASCPSESGWYYATEDAVAYYLNPCNFLTETYIFQFEQLTFNSSYHSEAAVQSFLNSTFMKGTIPGENQTYAQAFYQIGKDRKLSPIHLASRVYQEQGQGNSALISGTYSGYEGYYNYFNVGVYGSSTTEKVVRGLTYAKSQGWNTRYLSLKGGAATIGNNYIRKCQDTIYLEKFNVDSNSPYGLYNHQYMQNIQAPASEASTTKKMYTNAGSLNSAFVFKIPVYQNMPGLKLDQTQVTMNKGESVTLTASVNGTGLDSSKVTWTSDDTTVATVANGTITAQNVGTANITASYEGNAVVCKVTVNNHLSGISFEQEEYILRRPDTVVTDGENLSTEADDNVSTIALQVIFEPEDTTDDKTIAWSSSNKKIATVDANGVVTAIATGEATITAKATKAGNKIATCKVKVIAPIYQMELTNASASDTILVGQSVNLTAEYWPKNTTSSTEVTWSSSDTNVATVTKGKVEGISAGTATIRAEAAGYSATYDITVEESTVTFMNPYSEVSLKTMKVVYGQKLTEEDFPEIETPEEEIFIGWYTQEDGAGTKIDTETQIFQKETVLYPYFEISGKGFYVVPVGDQTYTGSAIKPKIQVYDGISYEDGSKELILLELNKDYTVTYKYNTNVNGESKNKPTITVKGKGNYAGTEYAYFNIVPKQLTDTDITVANLTAAYTGKVIKSNPVVYRNGKKLVKNRDYTVTYPQTGSGAYQKAGTYPIVITGKGGYTGTLTIYETITADVLMSKVSIGKISNLKYDDALVDKENGIGIEPDGLVVTYKGKRLEESTDGINGDYTVKYYNNMAVGTATATITAVEGSGYTGSKSITYKITGTSIAKAKVTGLVAKTYTGTEEDMWQKDVVLTLNGEELTPSTDGGITGDYIVSYQNTHKVGNATISFKGVNEYTGTIKKTYRINAYDIGTDAVSETPSIKLQYYTENDKENIQSISSLNEITASYMKNGTKPMVLLYFNDIALVYGKDYTIAYKNNNAVTTETMKANKLPTITITGKGNYKGKITGNFRITDGDMSDANGKIIMTAKDVVYKNKKNAYKTTVVLTDANGKKLQAGKDYEKTLIYTYAEDTFLCGTDGGIIVRNAGELVESTDIPDAGTTIKVTVKGKGAYAGGETQSELSTTYRITSADISKAKVKVSAKVYNNGRPVTLTEENLVITLNGATLKLGEDYVIDETTYTNNTKKGKATVVIKGTGNYGGTKKITFTIGSKTLVWWKNLL
ncbi:MAG: Ig-like domain-containing protein [Lachnospiraceae bacterium]|nr:Ig-like domain-containing protein [Lachnospiraceae bacterium]